jgi:hypothetical protein
MRPGCVGRRGRSGQAREAACGKAVPGDQADEEEGKPAAGRRAVVGRVVATVAEAGLPLEVVVRAGEQRLIGGIERWEGGRPGQQGRHRPLLMSS